MGALDTKRGSRGHRLHTRKQALQNAARESGRQSCPKGPTGPTYQPCLERKRIVSALNQELAPGTARIRTCQGWTVVLAACASNKGAYM